MPRTFRMIALAALAVVTAATLSGCGDGGQSAGSRAGGDPGAPSGPPSVVATTLPVYALALDVLGDSKGIGLSMLVPAGSGCPHDYSLSPGDMEKLARAKLVLANGAGLEEFLLAGPVRNLKLRVVRLSDGLKLIPLSPEEQAAEAKAHGAHESHEADEEHDGHDGHGHAQAGEYNPHTFASPGNAARMIEKIGRTFAELDPANAATYRANAAARAAKLDALAGEFAAVAQGAANRKIVTLHNVFDYLARDAGLEVVAIIETEPGQPPGLGAFADLIEKVRRDKPAAIFSEPQYSAKPAALLGKETGVPVYELDPFATGKAEAGAYLAAMQKNLETLRKALANGKAADGR